MKFEIIPGMNETSPEDLDFYVSVTEFTPRLLKLKFHFVNPLAISSGTKPDTARTTILNSDLFSSLDSGKTIEVGLQLESTIPRQYLSEKEY